MNAVITGSSKGIGKAIAERFAAGGCNVFLCARNVVELEATANELQTRYSSIRVLCKAADLSSKDEVISFGEWCLSHGAPDILVNNAGTYLPGNTIDEPEGHLEKLLATNVLSAYHLTRTLIRAMKSNGSGHIFNICSVAALHAYPGGGSYSISKFALDGFSQNLRLEVREHKIKVTAVFPGAVFTDSWKDFDNSAARIMEASDIAHMVYAASRLSPQANVDEILIKPILGDL